MRRFVSVLAVSVAFTGIVACGGDDTAGDRSITVFAAASLTDAFADVAEAFESANEGVSVELSFAASSALREQILGGAPADLFASADQSNMDELVRAGEVEAPAVFATNRLQIVVPAGNPAGVTGLRDFARSELLVGLCAEEVPCGDLAREALAAAGVTPAPDTNEADVRALVTKVEAAELDAGLVYVTDVVSAGDRVEGIEAPTGADVAAAYPIGTVTSSESREVADAFVAFVLGEQGQAILEQYGFGAP